MCKFASTSAPGFRTLATDVREWVIEAPAVVQGRWEIEDEENDVRMWNEINEQRMASPMVSRTLSLNLLGYTCHCQGAEELETDLDRLPESTYRPLYATSDLSAPPLVSSSPRLQPTFAHSNGAVRSSETSGMASTQHHKNTDTNFSFMRIEPTHRERFRCSLPLWQRPIT